MSPTARAHDRQVGAQRPLEDVAACRRSRAPPCPRRPRCRRRSACRSRRCRRRRRGCARRTSPAATARPSPGPSCTARRDRGCRPRSCRSPATPGGSSAGPPAPGPALPQLLLMMVRFLTRLRAIASMHASALPHRPKPPDMIDIPSCSRPDSARLDLRETPSRWAATCSSSIASASSNARAHARRSPRPARRRVITSGGAK